MFQPRHYKLEDRKSGLLAFVVIDDTSLGPAAGGIRTRAYESEDAALADAHALARAMTYKCALAGLPAGGGKGVVMLRQGMDRSRGFERLGEFVDSLDGQFLTAGDLGTTTDDLAAMARYSSHVCTDETGLAAAVGRGCVRAMQACVSMRSPAANDLTGVRIAVQGCGTVGAAVAYAAKRRGAELLLADIDRGKAEALAQDLSARIVGPHEVLEADVDLLAPCAVGGVISGEVVGRLAAWGICGAANNILSGAEIEHALGDRGIVWVPDVLSSSGAVIEGVGRMLVGLDDCSEMIDRVYETTMEILFQARQQQRRPGDVARALAERRILEARGAAV